MSRNIRYHAGVAVAIVLLAVGSVSAQSVVYDWTSDSKVPESYPTIRRRQTVTFRIRNVNKILYTYRLEITQTPIESDDFSHLSALLRQFRTTDAVSLTATPCEIATANAETFTNRAIAAIDADPKLPVGYARTEPKVSVPLSESVAAWNSHSGAITTARTHIAEYRRQCATEIPTHPHLNALFTDFETTVTNLADRVRRADTDRDFVEDHSIDPGNNVSVTVFEMFRTTTIKSKTFTFPGVDILTLSAGALFSRIPDRTYEARKAPGSELNLLTVEGNSRATPSLAALLNYSLGDIGLDYNSAGLALSAGPVLKLGNQTEASSFGFFAGISGHLRHRFFITPGIHFGQFADFPVGFSNGSTVPENFGELTPVKRWTARFGLALTFRARDFSGLINSDEPSVTGDEAPSRPSSTPSPSPSPSPTPPTDTIPNLSMGVANVQRLPSRLPVPLAATPMVPKEPVTTPESTRVVSSATAASITRVTSITNLRPSDEGERIIFEAGIPIRDYAVSFRNGRFFLTIPRARLDVIQEGLTGRTYTDPTFERRGDDLVISFSLSPGTKARVQEFANGLTLDFFR